VDRGTSISKESLSTRLLLWTTRQGLLGRVGSVAGEAEIKSVGEDAKGETQYELLYVDGHRAIRPQSFICGNWKSESKLPIGQWIRYYSPCESIEGIGQISKERIVNFQGSLVHHAISLKIVDNPRFKFKECVIV